MIEEMGSFKIVIFVGVPLGGISSSRVKRFEEENFHLKFPRKSESVISLGLVMECLVGRLQRYMFGS